MTITDRFLNAKHWQIFMLTIGFVIIAEIILFVAMFANMGNMENDPFLIFDIFKFFPLIMLFYTAMIFGWFWSIATGLQRKVPAEAQMKLKKFKVFFFIPITYILLICIGMALMTNLLPTFPGDFNPAIFAGVFIFIIPVHFFSLFCIFYCIYFVAKTIKTVELQRSVTFSEFVGEFFMIWLYPFGIWFIQPRVNRLS